MFITALDFGSSQIKILVAELGRDNKVSLIDVVKVPSEGILKGEVVDVDEAARSLSNAFDQIKSIDKNVLKNVFVSIGSKSVKMQNSRGIVAVSRGDNEIYKDDIDRVVKASQAINLNKNRQILHTIIQEYIVDGTDQIQNPLGMTGTRLEVNSLIVDAFSHMINDYKKVVQLAGGEVENFVYNPLATSEAIINKTHKALGVVVVDIGFATTSISVFEENKLAGAKIFPIGSSNITNDLAVAFKCSIPTAEKIKLSYGSAYSREVSGKDKIDLHEIDKNMKGLTTRRYVSEIIEVRLAEIFELVHNELKSLGKTHLPAGAIFCGGGSKMKGIVDLAKQELKLPVHLAQCEFNMFDIVNQDLVSQLEDLEFSVATGLLAYGNDTLSDKSSSWMPQGMGKKGWVKGILKNIMP